MHAYVQSVSEDRIDLVDDNDMPHTIISESINSAIQHLQHHGINTISDGWHGMIEVDMLDWVFHAIIDRKQIRDPHGSKIT